MALGAIICGEAGIAGTANTTLDHLGASIDRFAGKAITFLNSEFNEEAQSYGAFCARVILETSCAALVGRFDPFRLLYLAEFQSQGNFEYGKPSKSGFRWTGDVLPDDRTPADLWGTDHDLSKVSRALFSHYADHVYWQPAVERTLDAIAQAGPGPFAEILSFNPETYVGYVRGRCSSLYSTLSKGVHWDFFVSTVVMDEGTIKDSIRESLIILGSLGLVSHFVPTAYRSSEQDSVIASYKTFRESFQ